MEAIIEKLGALLEDQVALFREMLTAVQAEKEAVIHADHIAVSQICGRKENLILNLKLLETQRERLMDRAAIQYGIPATGMRLQQLIERIDPPHDSQLRACGAELKTLINAIRELNTQNVSLLTHSIELITGSLNFLDNLRSPNPVYRQTGEVQSAERQGRFLSGHV